MAYIKADNSEFDVAADAVDTYITSMRKKMTAAMSEVNHLGTVWQGSDFAGYRAQFDKLNDDGSVYEKMLQSLEAYKTYLRNAGKKYKDAQSKAYNEAKNLPNW